MAKKAFLVTFSIQTRVVVDVPDDICNASPIVNPSLWGKIADKAEDKVGENIWDYLNYDNVDWIEEDKEMPYDADFDK